MNLTEKQKENIAAKLLPYIVQALYNAKRTMSREVCGTWWQVPTDELNKTEHDCYMILNICKELGIYPIYAEEKDGRLTHIWETESSKILDEFNWEKIEQGNYFQKVLDSKLKEKISEIKRQLNQTLIEKTHEIDLKYKKIDKSRQKSTQKAFKAKYYVLYTLFRKYSDLRHYIGTLKDSIKQLRMNVEIIHPDISYIKHNIKKLYEKIEKFSGMLDKISQEYKNAMDNSEIDIE